MFAGIIQIQVHLPGIRMGKLPELQVHDDEALKPAMKEDQINPIPLRPHAQPLLSSDEREIVAQLQQELLDAPDQCIFEFRL